MEKLARFLRELRCQFCHRLLCKEYVINGYMEMKCSGCGEMNVFHFKYYKNMKSENDMIVIKGKATDSNNLKVEKGKK